MRKPVQRHILVVLMVALAAISVAAGAGQNAREVFERARLLEAANPQAAELIKLYEQAVAEAKGDRALTAQALLGLARAQERAGKPEARATYERIVNEFGDQTSAMAIAGTELAAMAPGAGGPKAPPGAPADKRLIAEAPFNIADMSADGRILVGTSQDGAIQWHDLGTGETRTLVASTPALSFHSPSLSPDGRFVAYGSITPPSPPKPRAVGLWVVGTEKGAQPRAVINQPSGPTFLPTLWAPDGRAVLATRGRGANTGVPGELLPAEIDWVSIADGSVRLLRKFDLASVPGGFEMSPDGHWLAYSEAPDPNKPIALGIHVMSVDDGSSRVVVNMAGANVEPKWTPDGRHLLFIGDRTGSGLWSIAVENGQPLGEPVLVRPGLQRGLLGVSKSGALFYARVADNEFTTLVADMTRADREIVQVFSGAGAALSPDGKRVAFIRYLAPRDGSRPRPYELTVRTLETGQERGYPHAGVERLGHIQWRGDGSALIVAVTADGDNGRTGGSIYSVDASTGAYTQLIARDTPTAQRSSSAAFSADGKTAYMAVRRDGGAVARIIAVDLPTGAERVVAAFPMPGVPAISESGPVLLLSPDGKSIALSTLESPQVSRLHVARIDTGDIRELSGAVVPVAFAGAFWLPDSSALVTCVSDSTAGARLVGLRVDGGAAEPFGLNLNRLTGRVPVPRINVATIASLNMSRDGSRLAFEATPLRSVELWALDNVMAIVGARR